MTTDAISGHFYFKKDDFCLNVHFSIPAQGITAIFGHSGSGKTTLLRCIAGLDRPQQGELYIKETCWQKEAQQFFLPTHQRALGYVFQEASLFPHLNVEKNLRYGLQRTAKEHCQIHFDEAVHLLGIQHLLHRRPRSLSGGERQRVAIARALLTSPQILLMDEPLAALDTQSKTDILPYLKSLHHNLSIPIVYITHDIDEALSLADYMLVLQQGEVIARGSIDSLLTQLTLPLFPAHSARTLLNAPVISHDKKYHLSLLDVLGHHLIINGLDYPVGQMLRLTINARDVSLSCSDQPLGDILNCLPVTITAMQEDEHYQWLVTLKYKELTLLSYITKKASDLLQIQIGQSLFAHIKEINVL